MPIASLQQASSKLASVVTDVRGLWSAREAARQAGGPRPSRVPGCRHGASGRRARRAPGRGARRYRALADHPRRGAAHRRSARRRDRRGSDRFPSAGHLASWAGLCPGNDESAGKRRSGRTRKGSPWLRTALVEAAQAAARTKDTYLAAQYRRLAARRGAKRAAVAVAHSLLVIVYALLTQEVTYHELGGQYFDERDRQVVQRRLVHRLEALGYAVSLQPTATPAA